MRNNITHAFVAIGFVVCSHALPLGSGLIACVCAPYLRDSERHSTSEPTCSTRHPFYRLACLGRGGHIYDYNDTAIQGPPKHTCERYWVALLGAHRHIKQTEIVYQATGITINVCGVKIGLQKLPTHANTCEHMRKHANTCEYMRKQR